MNQILLLTISNEINFQASFVKILTDWGLTAEVAKAFDANTYDSGNCLGYIISISRNFNDYYSYPHALDSP